MRKIQAKLWNEVADVVDKIKRCSDDGDTEKEAIYFGFLKSIYLRQELQGAPDPALTEAVADFTESAEEAVQYYRLALAQSVAFPDEPTYTKRICMASRLVELGQLTSARPELVLGRVEAERSRDAHYVQFADELLGKLAV